VLALVPSQPSEAGGMLAFVGLCVWSCGNSNGLTITLLGP
jgi:hypothetical protein